MAEPVNGVDGTTPTDEAAQEAQFNAALELALGKYGMMQMQMSMSLMSDVMGEAKQDDG